jgi:hypothetical protein
MSRNPVPVALVLMGLLVCLFACAPANPPGASPWGELDGWDLAKTI